MTPSASEYPITIDFGKPFVCSFKCAPNHEFHYVWLFMFNIANAGITNPDYPEDKQPLDVVLNPLRPNEFEIGGKVQIGVYECTVFDQDYNRYEINMTVTNIV